MEGKNNGGNYNNSCTKGGVIEKKQGRAQEQVNCPRCNSSNTKFCYYNNYSLTQPRYFCKTCRRYWTEGGSLRNVPVGGGSRKNKKFNNISSSSSSSSKLLPDLNPSPPPPAPAPGSSTTTTTTCPSTLSSSSSLQNPKILMQGGQDLNLAFSPMMENYDHHHHHGVIGIGIGLSTSSSSSNSNSSSALELLRGLNSNNNYGHDHHHNNHPILMMPNSNSNSALFPSGFSYNHHHHHPMQEVKPTSLGFSVDHHPHHHQFIGSSRYGVHQEDHHISSSSNGDGGRLLFPFGDVKQIPEATHHVHEVEQNKEQGNSSTTGFWTGMIGEGSW